MKEKPILFSAPMVNAILSGQKTMTRRVVKPQPQDHHWERLPGYDFHSGTFDTSDGLCVRFQHSLDGVGDEPQWVKCPFGKPGGILWARETWAITSPYDTLRYQDSNVTSGPVWYRADVPCVPSEKSIYGRGKWRPSIFMPRWASRLTLKITDVRVERLQDISEDDAKAEGPPMEDKNGVPYSSFREAFMSLWDCINFKKRIGWGTNPFVWVVKFEKCNS